MAVPRPEPRAAKQLAAATRRWPKYFRGCRPSSGTARFQRGFTCRAALEAPQKLALAAAGDRPRGYVCASAHAFPRCAPRLYGGSPPSPASFVSGVSFRASVDADEAAPSAPGTNDTGKARGRGPDALWGDVRPLRRIPLDSSHGSAGGPQRTHARTPTGIEGWCRTAFQSSAIGLVYTSPPFHLPSLSSLQYAFQ